MNLVKYIFYTHLFLSPAHGFALSPTAEVRARVDALLKIATNEGSAELIDRGLVKIYRFHLDPELHRKTTLLVFGQHGDELTALSALPNLIDHFRKLSSKKSRTKSAAFLDIIPYLKPALIDAGLRHDGVDLNRTHSTCGHKKLTSGLWARQIEEHVLEEKPNFILNIHSGTGPAILYPRGDMPLADNSRYLNHANNIAVIGSYSNVSQSFDDYPTQGELIDFAHCFTNSLAFTVEVSGVKNFRKFPKLKQAYAQSIFSRLLKSVQYTLNPTEKNWKLQEREAKQIPNVH